jgi:hypothetical protein
MPRFLPFIVQPPPIYIFIFLQPQADVERNSHLANSRLVFAYGLLYSGRVSIVSFTISGVHTTFSFMFRYNMTWPLLYNHPFGPSLSLSLSLSPSALICHLTFCRSRYELVLLLLASRMGWLGLSCYTGEERVLYL